MRHVNSSIKLMSLLAAMVLLVGVAGAQTTIYVPGDHATIQAAVNAASPGDIIEVAAGSYDEMISVNKSLTLRGANAGIHPAVGTHPTETVGVRGAETILSHDGLFAIRPSADNITIDGFMFTGDGGRIIDTYDDANGFHLTNCIFDNDGPATTQGVIQFGGGSHTDMVIDFNLFHDEGDHTIYTGGGPFDRMNVSWNKFNVVGNAVFWSALPLVDGVFQGNEIDGTIDGTPGTGYGTFNIGQAGNAQVLDNWVHDTGFTAFQMGIIGGTVAGNTFERLYPYSPYYSAGFQLWGGQWGTAVSTNVTIEDNVFNLNDVAGVTDPAYGLHLRAPNTGDPGIDGTTIICRNNTFLDGGQSAPVNAIRHQGDSTKPVDAANNYWGDASGPYNAAGNPAGTGTPVGDYVAFDPWWADAGMTVEGTNATVYNVTQTTSYTTIQAAIDDANPGDLIEAGPRAYPGSITIDTPLTLTSTDGAASTIITGDTNIAVTIDADNVTLNGFTITNPLADFGVYAQDHSGIVITNNIITNIGPTDATSGSSNSGIAVVCSAAAVDGVTITGNVIHQIDGGEYTSANGIALGWSNGIHDITNALIEDNTIYDIDSSTNAWPIGRGAYGILINHAGTSYAGKTVAPIIRNNTIDDLEGLWAHGIGLEGDTPDALVQGNVLSNLTDHKDPADAIGVFFEANGFVSSTLVTHNSFTNIDWGIAAHPTTAVGAIDAPLNWYGSADVAVVAAQIGGLTIDYSPWLASGVDADAGTPGFQGDLSNLWVGPGGSIKEAIDAVAASGTVNVAPGEYVGTEQIVVTGNIQVLGDPADPPRLRPGFNTGSSGDSRGWWLVQDPNTLAMRDLILDGDGYNVYQGFRVTGGIEAIDCVFENILHPGYGGIAIAAFGSIPAVLSGCEFENIGRVGALLWADATVQDCTYTGKGTGDHLDYFLDIGGGASVVMTGCEVTNNLGVASSDGSTSAGVLASTLYAAGTSLTATDNKLTGNTAGVAIGYDEHDTTIASINFNDLAGNEWGITNTGTTVVDGLHNWWGHESGPLHPVDNPSGLGSKVGDYILFDPYLSGVIYSSPDPLDLNVATPSETLTVSYLGGYGPVYGYSIDVQWDPTVATAGQSAFQRPDNGAFATAQPFVAQEIAAGHVRIDAALGGTQPGIAAGELFKAVFAAASDGDVPIVITVNNIADYASPPQTNVPADDGQLRVDLAAPVVADVLITNTTLTSTEWVKNGDTIVVTATVTDNGTLASVTCDLTGFGGGAAVAPDAAPVGNVYTWTFTPVATSGDGAVSATVTAVDNLGNSASAADDITADNTAPQALTGLVAMPGHQKVKLSWNDATGLDTNFAGVEFRVVAWNGYPLYAGSQPDAPADHTEGDLAIQTTSADAVEWPMVDRDIYVVAGFVYDHAGNYGPAGGGDGNWDASTNYYLGDVVADFNQVGVFNGLVDVPDISRLGEAYGLTMPNASYNDVNVGPTDDYTRFGLPRPDGVVGFADLMIFAMNFGEVSPTDKTMGATCTPVFAWSPVDERTWALELVYECTGLKGINVTGDLPDGVTVTVGGGEMMGEQEAQVFLRNIDRNGLDAGMAVMGNGEGFRGAGTLLMVTTSQPVADLQITIDARGLNNEDLAAEVQETTGVDLPTVHALDQNFPNPFNPQTTIRFSLPQTEDVRLAIYDVSGRLVKTLVNEHREAGHHEVIWRGQDESNRRVATGTYFYVIQAGDFHQVQKMSLIK